MSFERPYDVAVIGAGVAGLAAGAQLAQRGASVCVIAKGVGSTHLAPGTIDVLGHVPELVHEPGEALRDFVASRPDHPYALTGSESLAAGVEWFRGCIERGPHPGYRYTGGLERNLLLPTALGAIRPSALVPETYAAGEVGGDGPVCVVGIPPLRDFQASLCAANLARAGVSARAVELPVDLGRPEANAVGLARRLDQSSFRASFAAELTPRLRSGERVALPAAVGLRDPHGAWADLQHRLGRHVFEIPTPPPSASGIRVYDALRAALRAAGGNLVLGATAIGGVREGERVSGVRLRVSGHEVVYRARWVVLATGGLHSGGIELSADWRVSETVFGLPLRGVPAPGEPRFVPEYFASQPLSRVGIAVGPGLLAEGTENVLVAGAALPGAEPWREGSGEGIALASAHAVAARVLEHEGAAAAV